LLLLLLLFFFFFNDTATTEIYTLSLHDALPIYPSPPQPSPSRGGLGWGWVDRKSTRLNSSHQIISYAVFCLKKKRKNRRAAQRQRHPRDPCPRGLPPRRW